jgi:hypothetical protein
MHTTLHSCPAISVLPHSAAANTDARQHALLHPPSPVINATQQDTQGNHRGGHAASDQPAAQHQQTTAPAAPRLVTTITTAMLPPSQMLLYTPSYAVPAPSASCRSPRCSMWPPALRCQLNHQTGPALLISAPALQRPPAHVQGRTLQAFYSLKTLQNSKLSIWSRLPAAS